MQRFQKKYNIVSSGTPETTGYGLVGPKTRAKLNEVFGGSASATEQAMVQQLEEQTKQLKQQIIQLLNQLIELTRERLGR